MLCISDIFASDYFFLFCFFVDLTFWRLLALQGSPNWEVSGSAAVLQRLLSAQQEEALSKLGAVSTTTVGRESTAFSVTARRKAKRSRWC